MKSFIWIIVFFIGETTIVFAQSKPLTFGRRKTDTIPQVPGQSANLYNQISDIFQASIQNGIISNSGGTYQLTSSIYGLKQLFNNKPFTDNDYINKRFSRSLNINFGFATDNNNIVKSFIPSVKYAFYNKRDPKNFKDADPQIFNQLYDAVNALERAISRVVDGANLDSLVRSKTTLSERKALQDKISNINSMHDSTAVQIETALTNVGIPLEKSDIANINNAIQSYQVVQQKYKKLVDAVQKGPLFTGQVGSVIKSNSFYGFTAKVEYLVGTGWSSDKNKPWDFDTYINGTWQRDSVTNSIEKSRQIYSGYIGLNKVLFYTSQQPNKTVATQSLVEIKGSAGMDYYPWIKYSKETTWSPNMDFVISIRLANNLFLPFELKYATKNSTLFGFLKLQFNVPTITKNK